MDTKKDALRKKLEKLLPDTAEEQAEAAAQEQLHDCETQIDELNTKIEAAKKNIRIKSELDEKIPKKADARKAAEDDWYNADKQIGILQTEHKTCLLYTSKPRHDAL